jgi:omega-6 fatty acid desaturase (delta-12 desaturase)
MQDQKTKYLRDALSKYAVRSTPIAIALFVMDLLIYGGAVAGAVLFTPLWAKLLCSVLAGGTICKLFVIGHDAAHGSYTDSRRLNRLIGKIAFLPTLHNFSLWQMVHNRLHHQLANFKGANSWSPLSKLEFDRLPRWRRNVERLYRSPLGFGPYYLVERWWKDKFFPRGPHRNNKEYWRDFALVAGFGIIFMAGLAIVGSETGGGAISAVFWGFVLPFAVWNSAMGMTVYLQHTHPAVPWFDSSEQWARLGRPEEVTIHVVMPTWYNYLTHHIMEHPAHHVHMKIPSYRLRPAQRELNQLLGPQAVIQPFSLGYLLKATSACKLYNYTLHCWTDFRGRPTSGWLVDDQAPVYEPTAVVA